MLKRRPDVFIRSISAGNGGDARMVSTMNKDGIIFACAGPDYEMFRKRPRREAHGSWLQGAVIFPNRVNNVLAFPGS